MKIKEILQSKVLWLVLIAIAISLLVKYDLVPWDSVEVNTPDGGIAVTETTLVVNIEPDSLDTVDSLEITK